MRGCTPLGSPPVQLTACRVSVSSAFLEVRDSTLTMMIVTLSLPPDVFASSISVWRASQIFVSEQPSRTFSSLSIFDRPSSRAGKRRRLRFVDDQIDHQTGAGSHRLK